MRDDTLVVALATVAMARSTTGTKRILDDWMLNVDENLRDLMVTMTDRRKTPRVQTTYHAPEVKSEDRMKRRRREA